MIKTTFYLQAQNNQGLHPISARFRYQGKKKDYGLNMSIQKELWRDNKSGVFTSGAIYKKYTAKDAGLVHRLNNIRDRIQDIRNHVEQYERDMVRQGLQISLYGLVDYIKEQYQVKEVNDSTRYLEDYLEQWIKDAENGKRTHGNEGAIYKEDTLKTYRALLKDLMVLTPSKTQFSDLRESYMQRFDKFCNDREYRTSTKAKKFSLLISICNASFKDGLHQYNANFSRKGSGKTHKIALYDNELAAIEQVDLSKQPRGKQIARDRFIIGCYTGLRVSDLLRFNKSEHIVYSDKYPPRISMTTVKGNQELLFTCPDKVLEILNKNEGKKFNIAEPVFNRYIKEVAKMAGIDKKEKYQVSKGGKVEYKETPRFELITSHTARRTAVTILRRLGWTYEQIMIVTGHKTLKVIQQYDRTTKEDRAVSIEGLPFIGDSHLKIAK